MRSDIVPGSIFPDYQLPDHTNTLRKLSEPGLREAWKARDFSAFHGWNKRADAKTVQVARKEAG